MKIIKSSYESVAKVLCSCCGEGEYFILERCKNYEDNEKEPVYYITFDNEFDLSLKDRIRFISNITKKTLEDFKNGSKQSYFGIFLDFEQLGDFYTEFYSNAEVNNIIQIEDINKINDTSLTMKLISEDNGYNTFLLYKSKDGLVFSIDVIKEENKNMISNISIGWTYPDELKWEELRSYKIDFLFKDSEYYFTTYSTFLTKKDVVDFLSTIKSFLESVDFKNNDFGGLLLNDGDNIKIS